MERKLFKPSIPEDFSLVNIESVCRICLQAGIALFSIFRNEVNEMISEFVPDNVDLQDNFPHQICEKCIEDVNIAYAFKKQAEYSHEVMKKMLNGKRLPRSLKKKNYQETRLFRTNVSSSNYKVRGTTNFKCHMCKRSLKRKDIFKRHLEKVHNFFKFDEYYGNISTNDEKDKKSNKKNVNENFLEILSSPVPNQIIVTDVENMPTSDDHDEHSMEEKDEHYKFNDGDISNSSSKLDLDTQTQDQKKCSCNCHICHEHLTTLQNLKYHLEKQHQIHNFDDLDMKPKMVPLKNSNINESIELYKSLTPTREQLQKGDDNYIGTQNQVPNVNNDISSDCHDNGSSNASLQLSKLESISKSNKTRTKTVNAYICHICEKEFSCRTTTRRHLKNIHKFENFEDNIWLSKVYQKTIEAKIYECEICKKVYAKTQDLFRHQLLHSGNPRAKPYSCTMCSKSFSRSNHLKTHVNGVHADLRPFKCLTCEKSFRRTEHLKRHVLICSTGRKRRAKEPTEHRFSCEICLRKFSTEKCVQDHIDLEHNETREFSCKYCEAKIIGSTEYRKHCKEHYKTSKQFLCSECGGSFRKLQDFKIHIKRHTGEKPFKCQYCDKAFLRPADQHAHERSHTGERNFKCTNCPKAFSTAYKLRVHMRIHTGERPYKCSYCPRAFAKTGDLKIHHKRRHTSERFYCDLCDLGFVQMFNLRQHKRQLHGVDEPPIRTNYVHKVKVPQKETSDAITTDEPNATSAIDISGLENSEAKKNNNIKNEIVCEVRYDI